MGDVHTDYKVASTKGELKIMAEEEEVHLESVRPRLVTCEFRAAQEV